MTTTRIHEAEHRRSTLRLGTAGWVALAFAVALSLAGGALAAGGFSRPGIELGLRLTARFGFLLFWPSYSAGALVTLLGERFLPLKRRAKDLGLAFAAVFAVHLGLIIALCAIGAPPILSVFLVFGPGFVCIALLAIASKEPVRLAIGAPGAWILRNIVMNYLLFDFAMDFLRPIFLRSLAVRLEYSPFAALVVIAPMLRLLAWLKGQRGDALGGRSTG